MLYKESIINNYDCYIFSIFWTPSSCATKPTGNNECYQRVKELNIDKYFTIHGLWPSFVSGKFIDPCNIGANITPNFSEDKKFFEKIKKYWPGLYNNDTSLWSNEYNKHGYCYIKRNHYNVKDDYKIYFNKSMNIFETQYRDLMEKMLPDSKGVLNVSKTKFKKLLENKLNLNSSNYFLICRKNNNDPENKKYLAEIRFLYDLNFERIQQQKSYEDCKDYFLLNFTDESKIPVYYKYDYYVYCLFYGPNSCRIKGKQCYNLLKTKEYNKFVIHGLWPSYKSGIIPQNCNIGEDIEIKQNESAFFNNLEKYWYSTYNNNTFFWTHEYNFHGLCYTKYLNQSDNNYELYFNKSVEIYQKYNFGDIFNYIYKDFLPRKQIVNKTYLFSKLREIYPQNSFFLNCYKEEEEKGGKYYLEELKFKLDMNFELTSEGEVKDKCPEEFYLEIMDKPRPKHDTNDDIWSSYNNYMISIFWQSTECKILGYHCYNVINDIPKNIWTLHGLWPNFKNGSIPGWCHGDNDIDIEIKNQTLYDYMKDYWPGLYSTNEGFWSHEYNRHGYCYNKRLGIDVYDYEKYFLKGVEIYKKYDLPNIFINIFGKNMTNKEIKINRNEIEEYFEKFGINKNEYLLICKDIPVDGKNVSYIAEIRIRFDFDFNLYKNETDKSENDCPYEFMAEFL